MEAIAFLIPYPTQVGAFDAVQGRNHVFKVGVQFLGLGYYYPSAEKIDRSTQFGAVGYIITRYSSRSQVKSWGVCPNFWRIRTPDPQWLRP